MSNSPVIHEPKFTLTELRFVYEYLFDLSAEDAALRVGLRPLQGRAIIKTPRFKEIFRLFSARRQTRNEIYADAVLQRFWALANADPRDIIEVHVGPCRYCWGVDHQYQYIDVYELEESRIKHERAEESQTSRIEFNDIGGVGYTLLRPPCSDCPRCAGAGIRRGILKDTRYFTESAKALYDGVKIAKDGSIEIKFRDRSWALEKVAQHLGMFVQRQAIVTLDPTIIPDNQLDEVLRQYGYLLDNNLSNVTDIEETENEDDSSSNSNDTE